MKRYKRLAIVTIVVAAVIIVGLCVLPVSTGNLRSSWSVLDYGTREVISLGKMNIYEENITLSGFSAGASMAIQTHLSHSRLFSGLAVFSQVFYHCGHRSLVEFGIRCSTTGLGLFPYKVSSSVDDAKEYEEKGLIDPLSNLRSQKIFIWTGELDAYIPSDMVKKNVDFYKAVGATPDNVRYTLFTNASHLIPTEDFGPDCEEDAGKSYYLGNCQYSGPYHALSYILQKDPLAQDTPDLGQLKLFNQSEFYPQGNIRNVAMGQAGFIYIPKRCRGEEKTCLLHVNFHGCNEWPPDVAEMYIVNSGFLKVAEGSGIIMIFPLTTKVPKNMDGCWDFYSYTGSDFATKKGAQIQVIEKILNRVMKGEL